MLQPSSDGNIDANARIRVNRIGHVLIIFFLSVLAIFYFSYTDTYTFEEKPRVFKIRTHINSKKTAIYTKIYVHPALAIPGINIRLNNKFVINVEASRLDYSNDDCTLGWEYMDSSSVSFQTRNMKYGLLSISVSESYEDMKTKTKTFSYVALIRADKEYCKSNEIKSWTCQPDFYGTNGSYDSSFCIIVVKDRDIKKILSLAADVADGKQLQESEYIGIFCGNPVIQRLASSSEALYFINRRVSSEDDGSETYLVCKYSIDSMEVSRCYDTKMALLNSSIPIAVLYDGFSKNLCTISYNEYNTLDIMTYDTMGLTFKSMFKYTPSPSGWFITRGEISKGKLIFTGDAAPFEVLAIYDIKNTEEMYHNIYL